MSNPSKLQLSAEESAMVQDSHWLLTKNTIMQKAYLLFGEAATHLQLMLKDNSRLQDAILSSSPKISKGENYKGLPYVMLDYPRQFAREHVFAIRTMFWWGNFLSVTWHLKGMYSEEYRHAICRNYPLLAETGFQLCIGEDEWRHDFAPDNYRPLAQIPVGELAVELALHPFCKLAVSIPLSEWNMAINKLINIYQLIFQAAGINFQGGEKGLSPGSPKAESDL
jgi:hypothetical protein